jgi:hypothetical protein
MEDNSSVPPLGSDRPPVGPSPLPDQPGLGAGRGRALLRGAAITAAWILFAAGWVKVWRDSSPGAVQATLLLLGSTLAVSVTLTWLWVWHNVSIFNRKGARLAGASVRFVAEADFLGHHLAGDWEEMSGRQVILVRIAAGTKRFSAERDGPPLVQTPPLAAAV